MHSSNPIALWAWSVQLLSWTFQNNLGAILICNLSVHIIGIEYCLDVSLLYMPQLAKMFQKQQKFKIWMCHFLKEPF